MNEDERGITPPDVTAMTVERCETGWRVVIEQGNGDVIKSIELTPMERGQLAALLDRGDRRPSAGAVSFVDVTR